MSEEFLPQLMVRVVDLPTAHGDVPEDGSGIDGVWTGEFPDLDADQQWFVAINADGEENEYRVTEDRTIDIGPFQTHFWWDTALIAPTAIVSPSGGEAHVTEEFDRPVEDQIIGSIEAVLDDLGYEDFEAVIYDAE